MSMRHHLFQRLIGRCDINLSISLNYFMASPLKWHMVIAVKHTKSGGAPMYAQDGLAQSVLVADFISKWRDNLSSERASAQHFFLDLCDLLGVEKPNDPENYCFERGALRTGAGLGWADVWKRNCFAWENKRPGKNLDEALKQLMTYALALDNPPLLVVCDRRIIRIHTHFTGTPSEAHTILLQDIGAPENLQKLQWLFNDPEKFRPHLTLHEITSEAAGRFAEIAQSLITKGHAPQKVAHFLIQCLFCMFAEDVGLLPENRFAHIVAKNSSRPEKLAVSLGNLFAQMRTGGEHWDERIHWFNGGLFERIEVVPLGNDEISALREAARMDWSQIEPSIFGTLFERGLDPALRSQLGANYTDPETIRKIIIPVVVAPLANEWNSIKRGIEAALSKARLDLQRAQNTANARLNREMTLPSSPAKAEQLRFKDLQKRVAKQIEAQKAKVTKAENEALERFVAFTRRLGNFRVLDAACGSGNFLYLALRALKDLEHRANLDIEALGLQRQVIIETSPANVLGIEINEYAAELARVTIWIGEIQWMINHGYAVRTNPILPRLDHIECRDAILNGDGTEPEWSAADVIIGNPPFIGDKKMRTILGAEYTVALRKLYRGRVPGGADYVTYWFEKARAQIQAARTHSAGLVATNSIRGGVNRKVLEHIVGTTRIFEAWSDEPWVNEGAAVRVSLICFGDTPGCKLDGQAAEVIHTDLTAGEGVNLTSAQKLAENRGVCFVGTSKKASFDIPGSLARSWLYLPNPNGKSNALVVKPWINGNDLVQRPSDTWIVDFGVSTTEDEAAYFEAPFAYVSKVVLPEKLKVRASSEKKYWWLHARTAPDMRKAITGHLRYIATSIVAKHRLFVWVDSSVLPSHAVAVVARSDDVTFGILQSRFHVLWSLRLGTSLEDRPRYTPSTAFETFPFPARMTPTETASGTPDEPAAKAIAAAARRLNQARENWLNPMEWIERIPEVASAFPVRIVAKPSHANEIRKRTLTNLYNKRPAWLEKAHQQLDEAVAAAYGWTDYASTMTDEEILRRLLALNMQRVIKDA